jgi:hypothetical protein
MKLGETVFHFEIFEWVKSRGRPKLHKEPKIRRATRGRPPIKEAGQRELQMRDWYLEGKTLQEIGNLQEPKITKERVRQLLNKYFGFVREDGGNFIVCTPKKIANAIEKQKAAFNRIQSRYAIHFFCDVDQFLAIQGKHWSQTHRKTKARSPASVYFEQKKNAKTRNIEWNISFPDWWKIWQESGQWEKRGRGHGYCMTRIGDTGGYQVGNVEIKTGSQNFSDSFYKHPAKERAEKRAPYVKGTKTHCRNGHKRTPKNTSTIAGKKICRLCNNERARKRYAESRLTRNSKHAI